MKILFDECVPRPLRKHLKGHDIYEVMVLISEIKLALSRIKPGDFLEITRSDNSSPWQIVKVIP